MANQEMAMKKVIRVAICLLAAVILATAASPAGAQFPDEPASGVADVESAERNMLAEFPILRASFDLPRLTDKELGDLIASRQGVRSIDEWGLPLTEPEEAELELGEQIQDEIPLLVERAETLLDGYAGITVEYRSGQLFVILRTSGPSPKDQITRVAAAISRSDRIEIDPTAEYSLDELDEIASEIMANRGQESLIQGVSLDYTENRVLVGIADGAEKAEVLRSIEESARGGEMELDVDRVVDVRSPSIQLGSCVSRDICDPIRAGLRAQNTSAAGIIGSCSSGFTATRNSNGTSGILTAAHCSRLYDQFDIGFHAPAVQDVTLLGTLHDGAWIYSLPATQNILYKTSVTKAKRVTSRELNSGIQDGDKVCVHGFNRGRVCGAIFERNIPPFPVVDGFGRTWNFYNSFYYDVTVSGQRPDDWMLGMSGGAVTNLNASKAVGLHLGDDLDGYDQFFEAGFHFTRFRMVASKIQNVEIELGVTVRTS